MPIRLSDRFVGSLLKEMIGKNAYLILKACEVGRTDEEISRITNLEIPVIRSLLNQLHSEGLIEYTREKDEEHNWFRYTWYTRKDIILDVMESNLEEELLELERKLDFESSYVFFACKSGCVKVPFEVAVEYDFRCPECGGELQPFNNSKEIREIKQKINERKRLLKEISRFRKEESRKKKETKKPRKPKSGGPRPRNSKSKKPKSEKARGKERKDKNQKKQKRQRQGRRKK